jgi:uncharacterized membrane protein YdfJ with MMPL/SSD domain
VDGAAVTTATKDQLAKLVHDANGNGLQVEGGGDLFTTMGGVGSTELIGLVAAMVILLIAFGSLLAMGLPIFTALFGIGIGFAVVGLLSHLTSVPSFATQLAAMIGLGVGIDYARGSTRASTRKRRSSPPWTRRAGRCSSRAPPWSSRCSACC